MVGREYYGLITSALLLQKSYGYLFRDHVKKDCERSDHGNGD